MKIILSLYLLTTLLSSYAEPIKNDGSIFLIPTPPKISRSISYAVFDANSHKILIAQDAHKHRDVASLTKLMTSYVAFKRIHLGLVHLDDLVVISEKSYRTKGSRSFIEQGDRIPLKTLLKGMIIQSGNDASVAIAEHIAGDEETFVKLMNYYAKKLGMKNTIYKNASGLPESGQYSSAYDNALISIALIKEFPVYYRWFKEKTFTHNNITQRNRNSMLWSDPSIDGLKTGYTEMAGYCLALSAKRDDMRLVSVVLGASSLKKRVKVSQKLLTYSFRFYETQLLMKQTEVIANVKVKSGKNNSVKVGSLKDIYLTLPRGQFKIIKQSVKVPKYVQAPIAKSEKLGQISIKAGEKIIANYPLYTFNSVEQSTGLRGFIDKIKSFF